MIISSESRQVQARVCLCHLKLNKINKFKKNTQVQWTVMKATPKVTSYSTYTTKSESVIYCFQLQYFSPFIQSIYIFICSASKTVCCQHFNQTNIYLLCYQHRQIYFFGIVASFYIKPKYIIFQFSFSTYDIT